jgi:hypothetical protein
MRGFAGLLILTTLGAVPQNPAATNVEVELNEWSIKLDKSSIHPGAARFIVHNA